MKVTVDEVSTMEGEISNVMEEGDGLEGLNKGQKRGGRRRGLNALFDFAVFSPQGPLNSLLCGPWGSETRQGR